MDDQNVNPGLGSNFDHDRDRDRGFDDRHQSLLHAEDPHRERERDRDRDRDRDPDRSLRDPYLSGPPHHSTAASIPIHQPVASRIAGAIHSPGGLLANHGSSAPSMNLGPSSGPVPSFGGPLHSDATRSLAHSVSNGAASQHQIFPPINHTSAPSNGSHRSSGAAPVVFGSSVREPEPSQRPVQQGPVGTGNMQGVPQGPPGQGGLAHGQQPILNDALTYLDQVKVQFHDRSDVYNRFLDIMKDFKSQAIDTPGVINRVSELFAGHPTLIQGFNTFLPPGYRIECGPGNDPNTIRVTTPMGTTVQSITNRPSQIETGPQGSSGPSFFPSRGGNWNTESPEATYGDNTTVVSVFGSAQTQNPAFDGPPPGHQPRATSQAPNVIGGNGPAGRGFQSPNQVPLNGNVAQMHLERRGPVEFNHAISYVNKIKNRFQDKPEIYKQFLEILQTYQREQKPIQDVYAQVTTLFHTAPDLLEDFKQFLPETPGQPRPSFGRHIEDPAQIPGPAQAPQSFSRDMQKMPPIGSFAAPASASKDNKKRQRTEKQIQPGSLPATEVVTAGSRVPPTAGSGNKKPKLTHKPIGAETAAIEPTLTPILPEPYPPTSSLASNRDEIAFFERIRKFLGNRATMNEFLKVCNLYNQSIIDRATLYHKGSVFLASNPDLMSFWKSMVGTESQDVVINNRPAPPTSKVSLSNCRSHGPSYRLLPKRERLKPCSGRDELCKSVLNDEWASHPTWASEDSGFVAHRKNGFEEGLHRIEEERHDYDFNIEANLKCIQLLEPIAQQMLVMSLAERENFQMPNALSGQSTSIFKRVCKKIYGEKGLDVVNDLFAYPFDVVPIVLTRMKQKDEEWRFSQREWEKVWHAQTDNMHLKSLDHMGLQVKQNDKRNLSAKHLVDVIKTKAEEQRRERSLKGKAPRYQFAWDFGDSEVIVDLLRLMLIYTESNGQHSIPEKERIAEFFEGFIPTYFDIPEEKFQDRIPKIQLDSGEEDMEDQTPTELSNGRNRKNGKRGDLLRGVLDPSRNGSKTRGAKDDSAASASKETTPEVGSVNDDEIPDGLDDPPAHETPNERWMPMIPKAVVVDPESDSPHVEGDLKADGFFPRPWYNFFCNQTIFVFFSVFQALYRRLKEVKEAKESVLAEIKRQNRPKPARDVGLTEKGLPFFDTADDPSTFWPKTLELIEEFLAGDVEESRYQEILRHYYLKSGWKLYTVQDLIKTLCRLALTCTSGDGKEKTPDLIQQYLMSREKDETSYQTEISARKFAEKCVKDGEMFVICWFPTKSEATVRWLQRDDTTFHMDEMQLRERWQYYISSYIRVEPTEGVPRSRLRKVVLTRNLPSADADSEEGSIPKPISFNENLTMSICLKSSKIVWAPGTSEYFVYDNSPKTTEELQTQQDLTARISSLRRAKFSRNWVNNNAWMKDVSQDDVQKTKDDFQKWMDDGLPSTPQPADTEIPG